MKKLLLITAFALVVPSVAQAGNVALVARDVPLSPRALQSAAAPMHFNMLGVHWRGTGTVEVRTRSLAGAWRAWHAVDDDASPDRGSAERDTWRDGGLEWAGASKGVQFRTHGRVTRVRAYYLWSRVTRAPARGLSIANSPTIVPRSGWLADEKILRAKPIFAPALRYAVVHHTAGTNNYSRAQAAAIVRGIEIYHVKGNGWNDIGYNFLVDRFGTVYEGRGGGVERNVIGAHAEGFNTGSVGVALIGNYSSAVPTQPEQDALANLLAWRLDVAHIDPLSRVVVTSGGNAKFRAGKVVTLRAISGHRDTGPSECPGRNAYTRLPTITAKVATIGLPKLYSPVASGALGGPIRFQARLSSSLPWTVTVADKLGKVLARGSGRGTVVDWTWKSTGAGKGPFQWTMAAGAAVRPATGLLGKGAIAPPTTGGPVLSTVTASPTVIAPSPLGGSDVATVAFTLGAPAHVTASVASWDGSAAVVVYDAALAAGKRSFPIAAGALPDGRYTLLVTATPTAGTPVSQQLELVVDRTLTGLVASTPAISPNGDGVNDTLSLSFTLAQPVPLRLEVKKGAAVVASVYSAVPAAGPQTLTWDGTALGTRVADSAYSVVVTVTDSLGEVPYTLPVAVDTTPPILTLLDKATLRFQLSEPATLTLSINGRALEYAAPKGAFNVPWTTEAITSVTAQARDAAGNVGPATGSP